MHKVTDLDSSDMLMYNTAFEPFKKRPGVALALCIFLGGIGAHRFYLGKIGTGFLYLILFWTFIPSLLAFFEMFFIYQKVKRVNEEKSQQIISEIKHNNGRKRR